MGERKHGTGHAYNLGCRCEVCRKAHSKRVAPAVLRNREKRWAERVTDDTGHLVHPDPYGGHGSVTAYTGCGCRCDICRAGMRAYRARKKLEKQPQPTGGAS